MKIHDTILGLVFALIGVAVLVTVWGFPKMPGQDVGPAAFPGAAGAALTLFGLALFVRGRTAPARMHGLFALGAWSASPRHIAAGLAAVGGVAVYALLADRLGFLIVVPPLMLIWHRTLGVRWPGAAASAVVTTLAIWGLFYKGLGVPLPWGVLKAYAF
jgi:putative tricarboxylic transport membrane protein